MFYDSLEFIFFNDDSFSSGLSEDVQTSSFGNYFYNYKQHTLKKVSVKPDEVCGTDDKKAAAFLIPSGDVNYAIRYQ